MKHYVVTAHLVLHAESIPDALMQVANTMPLAWANCARLTVEHGEVDEECDGDGEPDD